MSRPNVALAKLSAPKTPSTIRRSRLLRMLEDHDSHAIVWVEGPGGCGKSTLVAQFLDQGATPQYWFHVDEGDRDPSSLVSYLRQLASTAQGEIADLPYLTAEHLVDLEGFCRQFFRGFYRHLPGGSTLVLDNCHRAATDAFHAVLRIACEELPRDMRLIAISRHHLPAELVKLQANRHLGWLTAEDFVLEPAESRAIGRAAGITDAARLDALHGICGGWVAGLVLMLNQRESLPHPRAELDRSSREAVFAYFAGEIFEAADADLRSLLLRTALLPVVTPEMAKDLSGNPNATVLLDQLCHRHYFTSRRHGYVPTYAYHDLFRAFLIDRLAQELAPDSLVALRDSVARHLEVNGFLLEAIEQYHTLARWDDVIRIIRLEAQRLIDQGRLQTLQSWLDRLPQERIAADPWMLFFRGAAVSLSLPLVAKAAFEQAYEQFVARQDTIGQFNSAFAAMEVMLVLSTSFKPWDRWIEVLERLLESHAPRDSAVGVRAWYAFMYACLYRRPGHRLIAPAVTYLQTMLFAGELGATQAMQAATGLLAFAHFTSDEALAMRVMPVLDELLAREHLAVMSRLWGTIWKAVYNYYNAKFDAAEESAAASIQCARTYGLRTLDDISSCYRAQSLAQLGRIREARQLVAELEATVAPDNAYVAAYSAAVAGVTHYLAGDAKAALRRGARCLDLWQETGFIIAEASHTSLQVAYCLVERQVEDARKYLARSRSLVADTVCNYLNAWYEVLEAEIWLASGHRERAVECLRTALALCRNRKLAAVVSWGRPFLPRLFHLAYSEGIETTVIAGLVAEWGIPAPSPVIIDWPWKVIVKTFGGLEIRVEGHPLPRTRKSQRRLLEFVKLLATAGPDGMRQESMAELLWPEAEGDTGMNNFRTTLFRVRQLLGTDRAIETRDGRVRFNDSLVWVDTLALTSLRGLPAPHTRNLSADEIAGLERRIYVGDFLPDDDSPWVLGARSAWRTRMGLDRQSNP